MTAFDDSRGTRLDMGIRISSTQGRARKSMCVPAATALAVASASACAFSAAASVGL